MNDDNNTQCFCCQDDFDKDECHLVAHDIYICDYCMTDTGDE